MPEPAERGIYEAYEYYRNEYLTLARLVKQMRDCQKAYFRNRDNTRLAESKDAERRVDKAVAGILTPPTPELFGK